MDSVTADGIVSLAENILGDRDGKSRIIEERRAVLEAEAMKNGQILKKI